MKLPRAEKQAFPKTGQEFLLLSDILQTIKIPRGKGMYKKHTESSVFRKIPSQKNCRKLSKPNFGMIKFKRNSM